MLLKKDILYSYNCLHILTYNAEVLLLFRIIINSKYINKKTNENIKKNKAKKGRNLTYSDS